MKTFTIVCIIVVVLIFIAIITGLVEFRTKVTLKGSLNQHDVVALRHVISLSEHNQNLSGPMAERFPYLTAVTRNSTSLWPFSCFGSIILLKWIVTPAHCRHAGSTHRVILFNDFANNRSYVFPILLWRIHEKYNNSFPSPKYDIALAKLNMAFYPNKVKPALFDESEAYQVEASVWKTVSTMDKKLYLTNHFEKYEVRVVGSGRCYESYGVELDDSLICIDTSDYDDCFIHEFGPIYSGDKIVGLIAVQPVDCDTKLSIFTNVSYFTNWILRTTHEG